MSWMLKDVLASLGMGLGLLGPVPQTPTLTIEELVVGTGPSVTTGQRVTVHLQVSDQNGREYANTKKRGLPYSFVLSEGVMDPVSEWVSGMKVGGQRRVSLSPEASAPFAQIVPSNTPLVVVVTVLRTASR